VTNILKAGIRLQRGCLRSVVGAFTCVVAGAAAGVPAAAADLDIGGGYGGAPAYVAEEFSWTGVYFGGHVGYGWADWAGTLTTTAGCPDSCVFNASYSNPDRTLSGEGIFGGIQGGLNWQTHSNVVLGVEADVSWSDISGTATYDTDLDGPSVWSKKHDVSIDYFGTVRGRIGYAVGRVMPYITGGLGWGHTSGDLAVAYIRNNVPPPEGTSYASTSENHVGWAAGAGVEIALTNSLTLKAEYMHLDLGKQDYLFEGETFTGAPFDTDSYPSDLTVDTVKIGINYLFD